MLRADRANAYARLSTYVPVADGWSRCGLPEAHAKTWRSPCRCSLGHGCEQFGRAQRFMNTYYICSIRHTVPGHLS